MLSSLSLTLPLGPAEAGEAAGGGEAEPKKEVAVEDEVAVLSVTLVVWGECPRTSSTRSWAWEAVACPPCIPEGEGALPGFLEEAEVWAPPPV